MPMVDRSGLDRRLRRWVRSRKLRGLSAAACDRFLEEVQDSVRKQDLIRHRRFRGSPNISDPAFHPYAAIVELARTNVEEALWLTFLVTLCGPRGKRDRWESVKGLYGAFGMGIPWSWSTIRANPGALRRWLRDHRSDVRRLRFGNHRKYETHDPEKRNSTADVVESYVQWVEKEGQGRQAAIFEEATRGRSPEAAFDELYRQIRVTRFGRTARFDWLCLVGALRIYALEPGQCYLRGASGPLAGARKMFRHRPTRELEMEAVSLARALVVPIEAIEDSLCNWQKRPGSSPPNVRGRARGC